MSTTTTPTPPRVRAEAGAAQRGPLTGTGTVLRFMLRRDRIRFPAWTLGLTAMMAYFANALPLIFGDEDSLETLTVFVTNPAMALIGGRGYGFDDITLPRFLVGMYGVFVMLGAALMSIMTVSRHTRAEEQTGRAELVRANVTGRHAQLTAALVVAVAMNVVVAVLMGAALMGSAMEPEPASSAFLFALSIGAVGLAFAGVTAVTVQLSPYSRAASGMAGAVLGAAFAVRGLGDMSAAQDGGLGWLSWLSPLGWAQQTAPFTYDRWWPLLLPVLLLVVLSAVAYGLQGTRDLGAGLLPDRLGSAHAAEWLRGPLSLAYRLQRAGLIGWSVAMLVAGIAFGAFAQPMEEGVAGMPDEIVELMGGAGEIVDGYLGFMGLYFAIMVAAYAIISVQGLRGEEQGVRAEPVLATPVSRSRWLLSWSAVTAAGALWLLLLAGVGEGLGAAATIGDWDLLAPTVLGHVAHTPVVWFFLGLAAVLYGLAPRAVGLVWAVYAFGVLMSLFGPMLEPPQAALDASPFLHIGQHPAEEISWVAATLLTAVAVALVAGGAAAFRRRDLVTA
ncbi:ABC transporter permease [Georgenia sp. H159]|uniref:ABC transporter permease n=1 Tax=Georgenia sp. H159 TaxID=3076115 RepID=UPI002D779474|nr:ABC transporter permease [Georgenia sp. H159]